MRIFLKPLGLFALITVFGYGVRMVVVPDVLPIGDRQQAGWDVHIAFLLMAVQNIGLIGMAILAVLALSTEIRRLLAP
ncbi:MAG: hypothetical protein ABW213_01070 [Tardiphaga sp.]